MPLIKSLSNPAVNTFPCGESAEHCDLWYDYTLCWWTGAMAKTEMWDWPDWMRGCFQAYFYFLFLNVVLGCNCRTPLCHWCISVLQSHLSLTWLNSAVLQPMSKKNHMPSMYVGYWQFCGFLPWILLSRSWILRNNCCFVVLPAYHTITVMHMTSVFVLFRGN